MPRRRPSDEPFPYDDDDRAERDGGGSVLGAFVLGAALGAGLALILAPAAGSDTRRALARQARRAGDATKRTAAAAGERMTSALAQARAQLEQRLESARAGVEGPERAEVERARAAGREAARQAREDVQRRIAEAQRDGRGARGNGADAPHDTLLDAPAIDEG